MNKNLLPVHSYKLTVTRANLLGPDLYLLSFCRHLLEYLFCAKHCIRYQLCNYLELYSL